MTGLVRTAQPAAEPVSLPELKAHARITLSQEDGLLTSYLTAARVYCENRVSQTYVTSTWRKTIDRFPEIGRAHV